MSDYCTIEQLQRAGLCPELLPAESLPNLEPGGMLGSFAEVVAAGNPIAPITAHKTEREKRKLEQFRLSLASEERQRREAERRRQQQIDRLRAQVESHLQAIQVAGRAVGQGRIQVSQRIDAWLRAAQELLGRVEDVEREMLDLEQQAAGLLAEAQSVYADPGADNYVAQLGALEAELSAIRGELERRRVTARRLADEAGRLLQAKAALEAPPPRPPAPPQTQFSAVSLSGLPARDVASGLRAPLPIVGIPAGQTLDQNRQLAGVNPFQSLWDKMARPEKAERRDEKADYYAGQAAELQRERQQLAADTAGDLAKVGGLTLAGVGLAYVLGRILLR